MVKFVEMEFGHYWLVHTRMYGIQQNILSSAGIIIGLLLYMSNTLQANSLLANHLF